MLCCVMFDDDGHRIKHFKQALATRSIRSSSGPCRLAGRTAIRGVSSGQIYQRMVRWCDALVGLVRGRTRVKWLVFLLWHWEGVRIVSGQLSVLATAVTAAAALISCSSTLEPVVGFSLPASQFFLSSLWTRNEDRKRRQVEELVDGDENVSWDVI